MQKVLTPHAGEGEEHLSPPCAHNNTLLLLPSRQKMKRSFIGIHVGYKMFHFIIYIYIYIFFFFFSPYFLPGNALIYGLILANPSPGEHKFACAQ